PPPSRIFQGRQTILDKMNQFFTQDIGKQHIYVLHGLGGAGKTQIALKFINDSSHFTDKFFLDASTTETIDTGLKNIAASKNIGDSSQDALKWLASTQEDWLLFYDNADDPNINLNSFLPRCNHGNIVITSRNPGLRVYAGAHSAISDMEETDAVALLLKSAAEEISLITEKSAAEIVKELCYLPLAIVQAGAFISQSGSLNSYLDIYIKNRAQLLSEKPAQSHDDYAWTVYTTWQMSFDQLSQPATMLLQLCSFLHRDGISEEIFSRAASYKFPPSGPSREALQKPLEFLSYFLGPAGEWDTLCFLKVANKIMAYSLMSFDPGRKMFSIHPLVHSWSRTTITD
ncbi:P-loop containing nucleoside triphosphate hydrolase protein, partial [Mycena leptocephala]